MLKMTNVGKVYRADMVQTHALRDFSLTVEESEFVAVTGPSGSGLRLRDLRARRPGRQPPR